MTDDGTSEPTEWQLTLSEDGKRIEQNYRSDDTIGSGNEAQTCKTEWSGTLEPGPGPKAFVDAFTGSWEHSENEPSATYSCPQDSALLKSLISDDQLVPTTLDVTEGSDTDLSISSSNPETSLCNWGATAQFRTTDVPTDSTCRPKAYDEILDDDQGIVRTVSNSAYELGENRQQLTHTYSGTIILDGPSIEREKCTESWTLTYEHE